MTETTDLIPPALREAILAGDRRGVLDLVRGVKDAERLVLGPALMKEYALNGDDWTSVAGRDRQAAYQLARLGTAVTPQHAAWSFASMARASLDEQIEALSPRPVAWKRRFATSALSRAGGWHLVRAWVSTGVVAPPSSNQWTLGVLDAYPWDHLPQVAREDAVVAPLLARLLDTAGAGRILGYRAKYGTGGAWRSLVEACGGFDPHRRDAVIDGCLTQLTLALPTEALGFTTVLDHLELTDDEVSRRQGRFAALLLAASPPAQSLAASAVRRVLADGALDPDTLLDITTEALQGPKKNRIRDHLQLLDDAIARGVVDVAPAADAVADALDPERSDVAEALAAALGRWSSDLAPEQRDTLRATIDSSVPQPWPAVRRALGPLAPGPVAAVRPVAAAVPDPVDLGVLDAVTPVADLDELLVLMEEVLPVRTTAVELERVLDGMVRFRLDHVLTPVRRRAERAASSWWASDPDRDAHLVASAWLGHETPPLAAGRTVHGTTPLGEELPPDSVEYPSGYGTPPWRTWTRVVPAHDPGFLTSRRLGLVRLAHLAAGPGPLLSLPSSQDGTVGADELLARIRGRAAHGLPLERFDLAWAVLRLHPRDRDGLLAAGDSPELTAWLRAVARAPHWEQSVVAGGYVGYDAKIWHDPGAVAGSMDDPVHAWLDPSATVEPHRARGAWVPRGSGLSSPAQWAATLPSHPDVLVAHLQQAVRQALHDPDTTSVEVLVRSLGTLRAPWGRPSAWAVVMGLSAEHRPTRLAASEAVAVGASRGMLDPATLTDAVLGTVGPDAGPFGHITIGQLRPAHPMLSRVADGLADAAGIDDRTADVVQRAVLAALPELMGRPGGHAIVAVAAQLAERLGRRGDTPAAVLELAAGRSRTRTATEARRLVAAVGGS